MLLRAAASHHLLLRSRLTRPSLTPLLRSHQLVVALHHFALPPPRDTLPPHDWLCCRRCQCTGIIAVNVQVSLPSSGLKLSPSLLVAELALLPLLLWSLLTSIAIVVVVTSPRAIATVIVVVACCAITIIVDFVARCTIAMVVVVVVRRAITIVVFVSGERCGSVISDADVVAFNQPVWKGQI